MTYRRRAAPAVGITDEVRPVVQWIDGELAGIEYALRLPEVQGIQFETLYSIPVKFREGDLYYFAAGVAGGAEGVYIRDAGNWRKL